MPNVEVMYSINFNVIILTEQRESEYFCHPTSVLCFLSSDFCHLTSDLWRVNASGTNLQKFS